MAEKKPRERLFRHGVDEMPSSSSDEAQYFEPQKPIVFDLKDQEQEQSTSQSSEEDELTLGAAVAGFSSWFSSTISSAKEKSSEMLQYLKQDFTEFSDVVSEASKELNDKLKLQDTAKSVVETVGKQAGVVLDQMSTIFGVGPDDDDEAIVMNNEGPVIVDRIKAKIYSLALGEEVFLQDPEDSKGYDNWLLTFDLEKKSKEMNELLAANPHLQLHYGRLVPDKVSHLVFWHRFYYRVHEICVAEEEKERARKAEKKIEESGDGKEDNFDNEKDNPSPSSDPSLVDLSEEDQKRLLAEYEEEMKNSSAQHSRRSSGTHLSSSSSGSFAMVTHDAATDEVKVE